MSHDIGTDKVQSVWSEKNHMGNSGKTSLRREEEITERVRSHKEGFIYGLGGWGKVCMVKQRSQDYSKNPNVR